MLLKICDDGNRAAGANENRILVEHFFHGRGRGLHKLVVGFYHNGIGHAELLDVDGNSLRNVLLYEVTVELEDLCWSLVRNQAHGNLG